MTPRQPLRQPRVAELVAGDLRDRVLAGGYEGGRLPTQEALLDDLGVSVTSLREGLRILETEGLISVQRGNVGGAVIHRPGPGRVAYMVGLALQAMGATVQDLCAGLERLEPACAAACAERADRAEEVVPALRAKLDEAAAALPQPERYARAARDFHAEIVRRCGNPTVTVVVGALESLWTAQVSELALDRHELGSFADAKVRATSAREHERLLGHIAAGRARAAEDLARSHFTERQWTYAFPTDQTVQAARLGRLYERRD